MTCVTYIVLCSGGRSGGGGYDSYAADAQPNGQSFGARGSGGFDNYNSRGGESGVRKGREEGGGFGGSGGGGGGRGGYEASAGECERDAWYNVLAQPALFGCCT